MPISPPALVGKIFICELFVHVYDYIEDRATFTILAKVYSNISAIQRQPGLVKFLSSENFRPYNISAYIQKLDFSTEN